MPLMMILNTSHAHTEPIIEFRMVIKKKINKKHTILKSIVGSWFSPQKNTVEENKSGAGAFNL